MEIPFADLVEILHGGGGGDVEGGSNLETNYLCLRLVFLLLFIALHFYLVIPLTCTSLLHPFYLLAFFGLYLSQQESNYAPQLII